MATDVKARLTNTGFSAQKVRLVIDMVRGKSVADALNILKFSNRVCAEPLYKLIASAAANAEENFGLDRNDIILPPTKTNIAPINKLATTSNFLCPYGCSLSFGLDRKSVV